MNELNKKTFFDRLAVEAKTMDTEGIRQTYNALIRLIANDLMSGKKIISLPDLGDFKVKESKEEHINKYNPKTKNIEVIGNSPSLRFSTDYKLKKYCKYASNND